MTFVRVGFRHQRHRRASASSQGAAGAAAEEHRLAGAGASGAGAARPLLPPAAAAGAAEEAAAAAAEGAAAKGRRGGEAPAEAAPGAGATRVGRAPDAGEEPEGAGAGSQRPGADAHPRRCTGCSSDPLGEEPGQPSGHAHLLLPGPQPERGVSVGRGRYRLRVLQRRSFWLPNSPCSFVRPFISPCFHQLFIFVVVQLHITPPPPAPSSPPQSPGDLLFLQVQAAVAREASALRRLKPRSRTGDHRELWSGPPRAPGHPLSPRTSDHPRTSTAEQPLLHLIAPPAGGGQRLQEQQQQEEAGRLLAEKRRQARLLREQEERERLEREETERPRQEELQRQRAEAQRLVQEKRRREEEEQRRAQEERAQAMREAALLQKQRQEEEEEKAGEKARAERAALAQREDAERQVRRKRLEEIMRRTRRSDSPETKPAPARALPSDPPPKENTEPVQKVLLETVVKLGHDEDAVPLVAFKERRSVRTRTGLEELQRHQRAEVIS
ncbi:MAP7 domain-containing protein 1-like isoform X6 [Synchiropus splendidus]|uniref:MAP7 domain-containing protein 1-like isoform X6 n=1 Tax=Synchiropus splendidus TaxID=270530 RepID=UPI00237EB143|nr:MAP7 domain-containing protein 1-like isoform X6 [Synchiropus splendidus]